jgi:hypothetical protein
MKFTQRSSTGRDLHTFSDVARRCFVYLVLVTAAGMHGTFGQTPSQGPSQTPPKIRSVATIAQITSIDPARHTFEAKVDDKVAKFYVTDATKFETRNSQITNLKDLKDGSYVQFLYEPDAQKSMGKVVTFTSVSEIPPPSPIKLPTRGPRN